MRERFEATAEPGRDRPEREREYSAPIYPLLPRTYRVSPAMVRPV